MKPLQKKDHLRNKTIENKDQNNTTPEFRSLINLIDQPMVRNQIECYFVSKLRTPEPIWMGDGGLISSGFYCIQ